MTVHILGSIGGAPELVDGGCGVLVVGADIGSAVVGGLALGTGGLFIAGGEAVAGT